MPTCKEITELVTDYVEGKLPWSKRVAFQFHLGICLHCRVYLAQMQATKRALGHVPAAPLPDDVRDELLRRFKGWTH
jgi:anti-sigma factor RsiW